jgi:Flp pilus assembly pilin Flp
MSQLNRALRQMADERGQTMTEYAMILSAIAVVLVSFLENAGTIIATLVGRVDPLL